MTKYKINFSKSFKKSYKKLNQNEKLLTLDIIAKLANDEVLKPKFKDHKLQGKYKDFKECHIKPDLLLIYQKQDEVLILTCVFIGSHSELFK